MSESWYLGGPMRGQPQWGFPKFIEAAALLRAEDFEIVSPAEHDIEMGFTDWETSDTFEIPGYGLAECISWDLNYIASPECQGIFLLPGWEKSSGARLEVTLANFLSKRLFQFKFNEHALGGYLLIPVKVAVAVTAVPA